MLDANAPIPPPSAIGDTAELTDIMPFAMGQEGVMIELDGQPISCLLQFMNGEWIHAQQPRMYQQFFGQHHILDLAPDLAISKEIHELSEILQQEPTSETDRPQEAMKPLMARTPEVHRSLFSLANSVYQARPHQRSEPSPMTTRLETSTGHRSSTPFASSTKTHAEPQVTPKEATVIKEHKSEHKDKQERQGGQGGQGQHQQRDQQQKKRHSAGIQATTRSQKVSDSSQVTRQTPPESTENIYVRFMNLMARILSQAEAEAHDLYQRIKNRTDQVDLLTSVLQKVNASSGEWDISRDQQALQLLQRARELGVEIPEGKTKWTEEEKRLLKENVQMRKDSMEKITQLERTDMQRFLQEASQCHQARSNILKLLKEVMDAIIYNLRP